MEAIREALENRQIPIYLFAVALAGATAFLWPGAISMEVLITPALALMLFATFFQLPLSDLRRASTHWRFLAALLCANFVVIPLLMMALVPLLPVDQILRLGVLLVLLSPCIDYVITFAHLGRADSRLLIAATPVLLAVQFILLPAYLGAFLQQRAIEPIAFEPFLNAFLWLIGVPLILAVLVQHWSARRGTRGRLACSLGLLPVPATAVVLYVVVAALAPRLESIHHVVWQVVPIYIVFAAIAPLLGWLVARLFQLDVRAGRAVAFSAGTRNSLVILPLAFAVPAALPVLPAVIVTQTLVELLCELVYLRLIPLLGRSRAER